MLICGKFIAKHINLWSTLSDFRGPRSKSSGALKKDSTFGFLTFGYALKTRPWINLFQSIVLCLLSIAYLYWCNQLQWQIKNFLAFLSILQLHNFIEWIHYFIVKLLKFCQSNTDLAEIEYEKSIKIIASLYIFFFQKVKIFTMIEINFSNFSCMFLNPNNFFQFEF